MKYQPPFMIPANPDPNAPFVNGVPSAGIKGSIIPAEMIEYTQREVVNCITKGGVVPADNDMFQLTKGVRRALFAWGIDTGSTNSINVQLDPPLNSYAQGLEVRVLVANTNTASTTIRINGLSTQQIVKKDGSTLLSGDLRAGGIAVLVHDGSNFQLVSGAAGSTTIIDGWFNGAEYVVDIGTANHIIGTPAIAPTAYAAGQSFTVLVKLANLRSINSGAVDVNINALGAKALILPTGFALQGGDLAPLMLIRISYDGTKFTMMSPIDEAIIDTAITKSIGPSTADFPDLYAATEWATRRRVSATGYLILALQGQTGTALVHTMANDYSFDHPDGERITIQGSGMNSVPSSGGAAGASVPANPTEAAFNVGVLRAAFQSELRFAAGKTCKISGRLKLLKNILIAGQTMSPGGNGGLIIDGYTNFETLASVLSPAACLSISPNATLTGINLYIVGAGVMAIALAHSSNLLVGGAFGIAQSNSDGIQAAHGAVMQFSGGYHIHGCGGNGINHWGASALHAAGGLITVCGGAGVVTNSATSWVYGTNVSSCNQGFTCAVGGDMDCNTCTTNSNANGDYICNHGAYMYAAAFQTPGAQFSPARNTFGNGGAYIEG